MLQTGALVSMAYVQEKLSVSLKSSESAEANTQVVVL